MNINTTARAPWLVVGIAAALALTGCAGGSPATENADIVAGDIDEAAAAALPQEFKDAGVINVASDIPFPPMEMLDENQQLTGFDYDLAQAIGAKLGVKLELRTQAFDSVIPSLQSGKHDIIMSGMNDTAERQETLDFVDYLHAGFSILVPKGNPEGITGVLDLCGRDVAVQKATVQADILRSYDDQCADEGPGPMKIMELPLETDVQTAVRSGKAIADVVDSAVAAYAAQTAGDGTMFELVRDPENPAGYNPLYTGIGVLKEDSALSEALLLALEAVIADGTYDEILEKYDMSDFTVGEAGINLGS
jgi:polar amino acid transport system substrate-binding protein